MVGLYVSVVALFGGIGSIGPTNISEYGVLTFILFTGCFYWAFVISTLCSLLSTLNPHVTAFRQTMDQLNMFMEENEFTQGHRVRIRRFFRATQDFARRRESRRLLDKMSDRLKGDTALLIGVSVLNKVWYFSMIRFDIEKGYLASVAVALEKRVYEPKEQFPIDDLTVVGSGTLCVGLRIMGKGRVLGLDCLIPEAHAKLRNASEQLAASLTFVDTSSVSRTKLMSIARAFPRAQAHLQRVSIKLTLRAAIRSVVRRIRADRIEERNTAWRRNQLKKQPTHNPMNPRTNAVTTTKVARALVQAGKTRQASPSRVSKREPDPADGQMTMGMRLGKPKFGPGDRLLHEKRGPGTVAELTEDGLLRIIFDNGEQHRYGEKSWHKLQPLHATAMPTERMQVVEQEKEDAGGGASKNDMEQAMAAGFAAGFKGPLALFEDAPSARLVPLRAQAAPTHLRAQPDQLGGLCRGLRNPRAEDSPLSKHRLRDAAQADGAVAQRAAGADGAARGRRAPAAGARPRATEARGGAASGALLLWFLLLSPPQGQGAGRAVRGAQ